MPRKPAGCLQLRRDRARGLFHFAEQPQPLGVHGCDAALDHDPHQLLAIAKMVVNGGQVDAGLLDQVANAHGIDAAAGKQPLGGVEDVGAGIGGSGHGWDVRERATWRRILSNVRFNHLIFLP